MDFRSFMIEGVDGEFHFSPEGCVGDEKGISPSTMSVNNETLAIEAKSLTSVPLPCLVDNTADSDDAPSERDDVILVDYVVADKAKKRKVSTSSNVAGKRKQTAKSPGRENGQKVQFPWAKELKDSADCHWVVAHVPPPSRKQHLKEIRKIDDPNTTMEEYIRLEEEKARRHGKVYNWETDTCGRIWDNNDVHDLRSVETEFPAIVLNDESTSQGTLSCEPTESSLNDNEIDFRISFDESDDEDYIVIFDKNSFSYKIISINDMKTDSENDYDKVNIPSFPSPEPTFSYLDDLDFFNDFENEFPAIVYNDALTSKLDFLIEPSLSPQHIDEFDLKNETSLSECDEEEQNLIYFNDLFPFNVISPDDLKSDKDNDDNKIDIKQSSRGNVINTDVGAYAQG
ncbi:hypothetical protein Tco_0997623 [Tanacetum coccineum]